MGKLYLLAAVGPGVGLELLFSGPGYSQTYRNTWPGWYDVGGYVLDAGVMLSGIDGKREAYDTAGLVGVRFEDTGGGFLEFELYEAYRNRPLCSVVASCMGDDRENDGSLAWRRGHCAAGRLRSTFGVIRPAQELLIGWAGNSKDGLDWVLFRLQDIPARSEYAYALGSQNRTNPGFMGRVYIHGIQHTVTRAGMWKAVTRPCEIDQEGCITSHNFPKYYGSQEHCSLEIEESLTGPLLVTDFETEEHDILTVNGQDYSGTRGPGGVIPHGEIIWRSDHSMSKSGWRLCPPEVKNPPWALVALPVVLLATFCVVCYCGPTYRIALRRWNLHSSSPSSRLRNELDDPNFCGGVDALCDEEASEDPAIRDRLLDRRELAKLQNK